MYPNHLPVIGIILALPLVFFFPGYALIETLFPRQSFDRVYYFVLSLGLSLVIDILGGFILNMVPGGLQAKSWAVFLGALTAFFSLLAVFLHRKRPVDEIQAPKNRLALHEYILLGLSIVVVILSLQYSVTDAIQQPRPGFTQLWIFPSSHAQQTCAIDLGMQSFEANSVTYKVSVLVNGVQVKRWSTVVLAPQEKWDHQVPISVVLNSSMFVKAVLYRLDKPGVVYREVHLTLRRASQTGQTQGCTT